MLLCELVSSPTICRIFNSLSAFKDFWSLIFRSLKILPWLLFVLTYVIFIHSSFDRFMNLTKLEKCFSIISSNAILKFYSYLIWTLMIWMLDLLLFTLKSLRLCLLSFWSSFWFFFLSCVKSILILNSLNLSSVISILLLNIPFHFFTFKWLLFQF